MGGGGSKSKYTTVGYKYFIGMHIALVHEMDYLEAICVGERRAWDGYSAGGRININEPNLFGGEKREGGVVGAIDLLMGGPSQGQNDYLVSRLGNRVPAFRNIVTLVLRQMYLASMNPYIKPWKFLATRTSSAWYPAKSEIGWGNMNPAHIIYECLTNTKWGLGYSTQTIDNASFTAVADTLYAEGFGLSTIWSSQNAIEDFIADIRRHIDGILYTHPRTGLWSLKLLRGDYNKETVPVFGPDQISKLDSFVRIGFAERANQLTVKYYEVEPPNPNEGYVQPYTSEQERSITVHNPAAKQSQGQVIAETVEYPAITNGALAAKVATRDLQQRSAALAKVTISGNRELTQVLPGDVFKFVWPELGITSMYLRVLEIDYGTPDNREVTIDAIEDYYGIGAAVVAEPTPTGWENPVSIPQPSPVRKLLELPYFLLIKAIVGDIPAIQDAYDPKAGVPCLLALKPTQDAMTYDLMTLEGTEYVVHATGDFTPTAITTEYYSPTNTEIHLESESNTHLVPVGAFGYFGEEIIRVTQLINGGVAIIERGLLDTVPVGHLMGTRIWFPGIDDCGYDGEEYLEGETVKIKALTRTARGQLFIDAAPFDTITLRARAFRPYPPGNVRLNGQYFPSAITGPLVLTWAHRDRLQQTSDVPIQQSAGNVGPEAGTTYTIRLYNEADVLKRTVTGLTDTTYTWTTEEVDCGLTGRLNTQVRVEIESVRDGYTSWQKWDITVPRV